MIKKSSHVSRLLSAQSRNSVLFKHDATIIVPLILSTLIFKTTTAYYIRTMISRFSDATLADHMKVELIAPQYVKYHNSAELYCNHTVSDNLLHKIEFMKNNKRIFQYIKERNPPYIRTPRLDGAELEVSEIKRSPGKNHSFSIFCYLKLVNCVVCAVCDFSIYLFYFCKIFFLKFINLLYFLFFLFCFCFSICCCLNKKDKK